MITQELLRKIFHYDPETGVFKRIGRLKCNGQVTPCDFVGTATSTHGYFQYTVKNKTYDVHRLIFMYAEGEWPPEDVDHINGNRQDNRWVNLRLVSRRDNLRNSGKEVTSESGHRGVGRFQKGWRVWIGDEHKAGFKTKKEAIAYRLSREIALGYTDGHMRREGWK